VDHYEELLAKLKLEFLELTTKDGKTQRLWNFYLPTSIPPADFPDFIKAIQSADIVTTKGGGKLTFPFNCMYCWQRDHPRWEYPVRSHPDWFNNNEHEETEKKAAAAKKTQMRGARGGTRLGRQPESGRGGFNRQTRPY
jgi:hypothetical protein